MSIGWSATANSNFIHHRCSRNPWTGAQEDYSSSCNSAHGIPMLHTVNPSRISIQHTNDYQEDITGGIIRIPSGYVTQMPVRHPQRVLHCGPSISGYISHSPSDRPITPISISTADGVVDPWGGRCRTFEKCCNYFLKVIFTFGILSGISLVMAGYILSGQRGGEDATDNTVYVYIGALLGMVSILLLSIQCNAQRERSRKKKFRRSRVRLESRVRDHRRNSAIPLRSENQTSLEELHENGIQLTEMHSYSDAGNQYTQHDDDASSENGTPWWRRERDATYKYDYPMGQHLPYSNKAARYLS